MRRSIITDDIDLSSKKIYTENEFYKSKSVSTTDSHKVSVTQVSDSVNLQQDGTQFYAVMSVSDKIINGRKYSYDSWKQTVIDGSWVKPYNKPILKNHDLYNCEPVGRIQNAFMIDNATKQVVAKSIQEELPQDVINFFDSKGVFSEGTGALICRFTADDHLAARIKSGLDVTVSQSSFMEKATCSICGKDYFGDECTHFAGELYEDKENGIQNVCYIKAEDFDPIELSFVNLPANDVSVICTYTPKANVMKSHDEQEKGTMKDMKNTIKDEQQPVAPTEDTAQAVEPVAEPVAEPVTEEPKDTVEQPVQEPIQEPIQEPVQPIEQPQSQEPKTEDSSILKEIAKKYLSDKMNVTEKTQDAFEKLFGTASEEQIECLYKIISCRDEQLIKLADAVAEPVAEEPKAEPTVEPEAEPEKPTEDEKEPKVEDEQQAVEEPVIKDTEDKQVEDKQQEPTTAKQVTDFHNMFGEFYGKDTKTQNQEKAYDPIMQAMLNNL